jgi:hypothetical protein
MGRSSSTYTIHSLSLRVECLKTTMRPVALDNTRRCWSKAMFHKVIAWDDQIATVILIVVTVSRLSREEALVNLFLISS